MTFPASDVGTGNTDASTDSPAAARSDLLDLMQKFNLLRNHFSPLGKDLVASGNAADACAVLGAQLAGAYAASGPNSDITSLSGLVGAGLFPVGGLYVHTGSTAPTGYIKANGALLSRSAYSGLWAFAQASGNLASSDGVWTTGQYSPGDGSTTFRIPDLRAEFIRMWDDGRGVDSGRSFGSWVADELRSHSHNYVQTTGGANGIGATTWAYQLVTGTTSATGGAETRPRSVAYLPCIKY